MYKHTIWAKELQALQDESGLVGNFHTLSEARKPNHTEQVLRRLEILGFGIEDDCIHKPVSYMNECLLGHKIMPDQVEKSHNWSLFTRLMLATWIMRFTDRYPEPKKVADQWAVIITEGFKSGSYSHMDYVNAYEAVLNEKIKGDRFIDFVSFYQVSLLVGRLEPDVEEAYIDYIMTRDKGIYYMGYNQPLIVLPESFQSKQASKFIANIEMIARYESSRDKLAYVVEWLNAHKGTDNQWDMGSGVKDYIYFPLSDSWRNAQDRKADVTYRINRLIDLIGKG